MRINVTRSALDRWSVLTIVVLPIVLVVINDNWLFIDPRVLINDPWIYSGFHLHLPEFLKRFGGTYYASRVPWIISGWLLHAVFDDERAFYILHFAFIYLALFSLYLAVRTIFDSAVGAAAGALLMGADLYFLVAAGWDYVDGPANAFLLAGLAALAGAAIRSRWRLMAFLWGMTTCATVSLYILLAVLVPVQIGLFLLLNRVRGRRPVLSVAAFFAAGNAAAMLLFGLLNWLLGGPFLYILSQILALQAVAQNRVLHYRPILEWAWGAHWLLVTAIVFAFACAYALMHVQSAARRIREGRLAPDVETALFICCVADIAATLVFAGLEVDQFYLLQMYYRANALLPFVYLATGGALAVAVKPLALPRQAVFLGMAAIIAVMPWVLVSVGHVLPAWTLFDPPALELGWIVAGALVWLLAVVAGPAFRLGRAVVAVLILSAVNLGVNASDLEHPPSALYKAETLSIFDASRAIAPFNADVRARFWYDGKAAEGAVFKAIATTYLYEYSLVNEDFPRLPAIDGQTKPISPGERIIVLAPANEDAIAAANAAVAGQGLAFAKVAKIDIRRRGVAFDVTIADVKRDPAK